MVDCHGSQCGFCTPGFVMSLFALQKNRAASGSSGFDKADTLEALAGNLCRCTGYRPIIDAAEQACCQKQPDQFDAFEPQTVEQLKAIAPRDTAELNSGDKRCLLPLTVADLADLYAANPEARLLAGGTDLALEVTQFHRELPVMIYVGHIEAMKRVEVTAEHIEIGAATSLSDCYAALA
jgi:xanthine dehydrogenase small subunit